MARLSTLKPVAAALALLLAVAAFMLPGTAAGMTAEEKAWFVSNRCTGTATDPWTDYLAVLVGSDSRFTIGAYQPQPWDLLYTWPENPYTSYATVRIDGQDNIYGDPLYGAGYFLQEPTEIDSLTNVSRWKIGDIVVTQTLKIVAGTTTGNPDTTRISYEVRNVGSAAHEVGVRSLLDTEINYNDGAPFRIPGLTDAITTETELFPPNIPQYYQAFFDLNDPDHVAQGTLSGGGATQPDRLVFASWPEIFEAIWDYDVEPGKIFGSEGFLDSAVAVYWFPENLLPGESRSYTTYYGIGGISGSADLRISGPEQLEVAGPGWSPNPFTVVAYLQNNTAVDISGDSLTLDLSGALGGLVLASGEVAMHALADIGPGETAQTSWSVLATSPGTWSYTVFDASVPALTAQRSIIVPELTAECTPNAVEACQTGLLGICGQGIMTCSVDGFWGGCVARLPLVEVCRDGLDNDCDGAVDQADSDCWECRPGTTQACATALPGICAAGQQTCDDQHLWGACTQSVQPKTELCTDGLDNDCDGAVDQADSDCDSRELDCSSAEPSSAILWSPNKSYIPVTINGIENSDGLPVNIVVSAITQDEPVDRRKGADASGIGTSIARIRADRLGNGNGGRVYVIEFNAEGRNGSRCRGQVSVCVPHDMAHPGCIDDGQKYDSTMKP